MCNSSEIECLLCWAFLCLQSPRASYFHHPCHLVSSVIAETTSRGKKRNTQIVVWKYLKFFLNNVQNTSLTELQQPRILGSICNSKISRQHLRDALQPQPHTSELRFRNGIPLFSIPTESMPCFLLSSHPHPAAGWRRELEVQKVRITGWDKHNLLETKMR